MLKFSVDGQKLELLGDPHVVADSFDFLTGSFKFYSGSDWDLTEKHVFFQLGTGTPYEVTLTDDEFVKTDHVNLTTGTWTVHVVGYDIDGATLVERITTNVIQLAVERSGISDGEPFPPSIIPKIIAVLDQTEEQTFENGVPKLAADRVISDDHHIVDKEYVDGSRPDHNDLNGLQGGDVDEYYHITQEQSVVLGNTSGENTGDQSASDFDHGDLTGLQGGSESERYHMTQAENTALHAHSNKTALDAVSGTNTGDQDVSGAISTHNSASDAHAILARKTETMRLLISRTIGAGEEVSAITWTQDDAGNPLSLREVRIVTRVPPNSIEVGTSGNISLRINDRSGASDYQRTTTLVSSIFMTLFRTDRGLGSLNIVKANGYLFGVVNYTYSDGTTHGGSAYQYNTNFTVNTITKLYAFIVGLTYFPEGTTIEIYGRTV